jgi:hypothetical protein
LQPQGNTGGTLTQIACVRVNPKKKICQVQGKKGWGMIEGTEFTADATTKYKC